MKQAYKMYSVLILVTTVLLSACSVSKEVRQMNHKINGTWILQTIGTEGATGKPKDKIFNEADFGCFIGSEWKFSKGGKGSYAIVEKGKGCTPITRAINWSINKPAGGQPTFIMHRLDETHDPMDFNVAFNLVITQLEGSSMKLRSDVMIDGRAASLIFNFVKQ